MKADTLSGTSDKNKGFSLLAGFDESGRMLVVGLTLLVLLFSFARAILFLNYRQEVNNALATLEQSSARNAHLRTVYQLGLDANELARHALMSPPQKPQLARDYALLADSLRGEQGRYQALLRRMSEKPERYRDAVSSFLRCADSLKDAIDLVFGVSLQPSGAMSAVRRGIEIRSQELAERGNKLRTSWRTLTQVERGVNVEEFQSQKDKIALLTSRWFFVSSIIFVIAIGITVLLIVLAGRASSKTRQLSAILEHSANPVEVGNPDGKVVYVNPQFERWSGRSKRDVIGTDCFAGLRTKSDGGSDQPLWNVVADSLQRGETWSGEVEFTDRPGMLSSLVVLPLIDRKGKLREVVGMHQDLTEKQKLTRAVEESRRQYRNLVESTHDGIVVVQDERIVFVNPAAVRIFQYESDQEMLRMKLIDTIAPPSRPFLNVDYARRMVDEDILKNYEMKGLTKQGTLIDLELDLRVITWNDRKALHASFRDISARKSMERQQAVWLWEQESLNSIDRQLLGIVDLNKVLEIILHQAMLLTRAQFVGVALVDLENRQGHWKSAKGNRTAIVGSSIIPTSDMMAALNNREHLIIDNCRDSAHASIADLPAFVSEEILSSGFFPLIINRVSRGLLVVGFRQSHRFAERETRILLSLAEKVSIALSSGALYEDLLKREKELELLSGARVQAQEEERRRISREIHDGLGQLLTAIKLNLEILEDGLPDQHDSVQRIGEVKQLLDNVLKEAREISYNLMPSVLDDFGLGPGLQSLCEQFSKRSGLTVQFHEHGLADRLGPDVEIGLYRIVQEALTNVAKHAEAKEVEVQIVRHQNSLRLTIEDDGRGLQPGSTSRGPTDRGGTGLVGMRERAGSFGGSLTIDSSPGNGTLITVEIPIP